MKSKVYTEKFGAALKQLNVEHVELQLKNGQFKAMQGNRKTSKHLKVVA